ncbi:MAG: N-acetylmuramoyl-L-alanine amidase [Eubacteriales bacterium]|nr:N-acetylmuramoyl-L-alanine amidase [Eubacteriales bacterium]
MIREPQDSKTHIFTDVMSGRNGIIIVATVTIICLIAASCAVFAAWQVHSAAKTAGVYITEPPRTDPPQTEPTQTDPTQTEPTQTEPPQTEPPQTEPPQTEPPRKEPLKSDNPVIIVDAGHGYDDPGTSGDLLGDLLEKNITLDIALKLGAILEGEDCEVYYTRKDDVIPKNAPRNTEGLYLLNAYAREDFINLKQSEIYVDVVVSVHCDSYERDPGVNGVRIFYYKDNSKRIAVLADSIAAAIKRALGIEDKPHLTPPSIDGLNRENAFYITKCTDIPSVLVETGFVTNKTDAANFLTDKWRQDMAQGIADGVLRFLKPG